MVGGTQQVVTAPNLPVVAKDNPPEGRQVVPFDVTLTPNFYEQSHVYQTGAGGMTQVRSITIDNSDNPNPVLITHGIANQTTIVPAAGGAIIPTTSSQGGYFFEIATASAPAANFLVGVLLANYELPPAIWGTQVVTISTDVPTGIIVGWNGSAASIPTEYGLCDGTVYQRSDGTGTITSPNLVGSFVMGANAASAGLSGGSATITQAQLPNVNFPVAIAAHVPSMKLLNLDGSSPNYNQSFGHDGVASGGQFGVWNDNTGNIGTPQTAIVIDTETVSSGGSGAAHLPPYYSLCYIMKL